MADAQKAPMRICVIGGGKMGEAILSGWIASNEGAAAPICADDVTVVDPGEERRSLLSDAYGVTCVADAAELDEGYRPDVVVLSVKPQVMMGVLEDMANLPIFSTGSSMPLFISIAAGLPTDKIISALPVGASLVRVMPNMPLMVGAGASGVCPSATSSAEQVAYVAELFGCLGRAVIVDEADMDAVCALSGSGPAYVAAMIEALRDAAVQHGLSSEVAEALALQTVLGTAQFIAETGTSPQKAREAVCSPGGTTLAALDAMNEAGFAKVFDEGVEAAVRRSKELAQC